MSEDQKVVGVPSEESENQDGRERNEMDSLETRVRTLGRRRIRHKIGSTKVFDPIYVKYKIFLGLQIEEIS